VAKGDPLLRIHADSETAADAAAETLRAAITLGAPPALPPLIHEEIT
jgi:thymidine phosphorylase